MKSQLLIFLLTFTPFFLNAQVQKGSIGMMGNVNFLSKEIIENSPFTGNPQTFFNFPTVDFYLSKRWSIGGSLLSNQFKLFQQSSSNHVNQFEFKPHLKYGVNFSKFNFFLSASGHFIKHWGSIPSLDMDEFGANVGLGIQWFLTPNIALETWWQVPIFNEFQPFLNRDLIYSFGLKFYNHKHSKSQFPTDLYDYYLDEYNIRFGFNSFGFQIFDGNSPNLFSRFQFSYENYFKDYFLFYLDYQKQNDLPQIVDDLETSVFRLKMGFKTYFPLNNGYYLTLKTGLLSTDADAFFTRVTRGSFGLDLGGGLEYFFPKKAVLKCGVNWQGTATFDFRATYSNVSPYMGLEIFLNQQISLEPRLNYFIFNAEEEVNSFPNFEIVKTAERSVIFEVKFRTLIYRDKGFLEK